MLEHVTEDDDVELVLFDLGQRRDVEVDDVHTVGEPTRRLGGLGIDLDADDGVPCGDQVFGDVADRAPDLEHPVTVAGHLKCIAVGIVGRRRVDRLPVHLRRHDQLVIECWR